MGSIEQAEWLVDNVNGNIPSGLTSKLEIRYANNAKGGGKGGAPSMNSFSAPSYGAAPTAVATPAVEQPCDNLYMKGFPSDSTEDSVRAALQPYGQVISCKVLAPQHAGQTAACLCRMSSVEQAKWLVDNLNGNIP